MDRFVFTLTRSSSPDVRLFTPPPQPLQAPSSETLRRLETVEAPVAAAATGEALRCDEAEQRNSDRVAMTASRLLHVFVSADAFARVGTVDHCVCSFILEKNSRSRRSGGLLRFSFLMFYAWLLCLLVGGEMKMELR